MLKKELTQVKERIQTSDGEIDHESLVGAHGRLLGRTGSDGRLLHTFNEKGVHVLVAVNGGYLPGFTRINIGTMPRALAIEAPRRALPGESVTMTVFQRGTEEPIKGANIWAFTRENAEILKERTDSFLHHFGNVNPQRIILHLHGHEKAELLISEVEIKPQEGLGIPVEKLRWFAANDTVNRRHPLLSVEKELYDAGRQVSLSTVRRAFRLRDPHQQRTDRMPTIKRLHHPANLLPVPYKSPLELRKRHIAGVYAVKDGRYFHGTSERFSYSGLFA